VSIAPRLCARLRSQVAKHLTADEFNLFAVARDLTPRAHPRSRSNVL